MFSRSAAIECFLPLVAFYLAFGVGRGRLQNRRQAEGVPFTRFGIATGRLRWVTAGFLDLRVYNIEAQREETGTFVSP